MGLVLMRDSGSTRVNYEWRAEYGHAIGYDVCYRLALCSPAMLVYCSLMAGSAAEKKTGASSSCRAERACC